MIIYRLQQENGDGLWRTDKRYKSDNPNWSFNKVPEVKAFNSIRKHCNNSDRHPTIYDDFGDDDTLFIITNKYKCACYSLKHFHAWFQEYWYDLDLYGCYEIEIDETDVLTGKSQVCFDPSAIRNIRRISIEEYKESLT